MGPTVAEFKWSLLSFSFSLFSNCGFTGFRESEPQSRAPLSVACCGAYIVLGLHFQPALCVVGESRSLVGGLARGAAADAVNLEITSPPDSPLFQGRVVGVVSGDEVVWSLCWRRS